MAKPRKSTPHTTPISPQYDSNMSASPGPAAAGGRVPPHDLDAERAVLGSLLQAPALTDEITEHLTGPDFYEPKHEMILDAILGLLQSSHPVDAITVVDELTNRGTLGFVGGAAYVADVLAAATIPANATYYAEIVRSHALRRRVINAGIKAIQIGHESQGDSEVIADQAQQAIYAATQTTRQNASPTVGALLEPTFDWLESTADPGLRTGFYDLDKLLEGLQPGQMVIVAARPGQGKSTFAMDVARHVALQEQVPTLFLSLEMSSQELMLRILAAEGSVPLSSLKRRELTPPMWERVNTASAKLSGAPLWLEDDPGITPMALRSKARQLRRQGLGLIVLDYLQLLSSGRKVESRQVEVSEFSRQIKLLAKEIGVPIIALSQLNRLAEQRADRKPALSDLRESGSLEQDADIVMLLHREEVHDPQTTRRGEADVIVAKNRNGETGTVTLGFQGNHSKFVSFTQP